MWMKNPRTEVDGKTAVTALNILPLQQTSIEEGFTCQNHDPHSAVCQKDKTPGTADRPWLAQSRRTGLIFGMALEKWVGGYYIVSLL